MHPNMSYDIVHQPSQLSKAALQLQKSHTGLHNMKGRLGTGMELTSSETPVSSSSISAALTTSDHSILGGDIWPEMLSLSEQVNSST